VPWFYEAAASPRLLPVGVIICDMAIWRLKSSQSSGGAYKDTVTRVSVLYFFVKGRALTLKCHFARG